MEAERPRPRGRQTTGRAPHVEQAGLEIPPRPPRLEGRRPMRGAQPDAHAARQVELGPLPLPSADADRARRTAPESLLLVEAPDHGRIVPPGDPPVAPVMRRSRDASVSLGARSDGGRRSKWTGSPGAGPAQAPGRRMPGERSLGRESRVQMDRGRQSPCPRRELRGRASPPPGRRRGSYLPAASRPVTGSGCGRSRRRR